MLTIYKKNIIFIFLSCFIITNYLYAEDCYVYKSQDNGIFDDGQNFEDGSEQNPYDTIEECISNLSNSRNNTIHVGTGTYKINDIELGTRRLIGSGVNVTRLIPEIEYANGITTVAGAEIAHLTFDRNQIFGENWDFNSAIVINGTSPTYNTEIHNCNFDYNSCQTSISSDLSSTSLKLEIRNNLFEDGRIFLNSCSNISFINNMITHDMYFEDPYSDDPNSRYMHNLFLNYCRIGETGFSAQGESNTDYNYTLYCYNNNCSAGDWSFQNSDTSCGSTGEFQDTQSINDITQIEFISDEFADVNAFAIGENSVLIDKGEPNPNYNDPDGTRADIGIMGGLYPWTNVGAIIKYFTVDPTVVPIDGQININSRAITE